MNNNKSDEKLNKIFENNDKINDETIEEINKIEELEELEELEGNKTEELRESRIEEINEFEEKVRQYVEKNPVYLVIMTPCYGGVCHVDFTICLIETMSLLSKYGIKTTFEVCRNDSLVSRARNGLIAKAMSRNPTHLFFIDSDIAWNPFDVLKLIVSDKELVGGIYPKKKYKLDIFKDKDILKKYDENLNKSVLKNMLNQNDFPECKMVDYNFITESSRINIINNLIELKHLPTGFMMIKRCVIDELMDKYKETKYNDDTGLLFDEEQKYAYALFDCGVENEQYMSEDWTFCNRYKKIGGNIYADITIDLIHIGSTYYRGKTASIFV